MTQPDATMRRPVNGVLLLDKPLSMSSQTAVTRVRHLLGAMKAGHTGTLDPMASGLLPICVGEATKFARFLLDGDKTYVATVKLGIVTSTGDMEGEVMATTPVAVEPAQIAAALSRFSGEIFQTPPMYSALKHAGMPLYKYARAGRLVERRPRPVHIRALDCTRISHDALQLTVTCGKGTYMRVLAEDIGSVLGCGGCLAGLVRTAVGKLRLDAAVELEVLQEMTPAERADRLLPVDTLVHSLMRVDLDAVQAARILTGRVAQGAEGSAEGAMHRVYGPQNRFLGVGMSDGGGGIVPHRLISTGVAEHVGSMRSSALPSRQTMLEKTNS